MKQKIIAVMLLGIGLCAAPSQSKAQIAIAEIIKEGIKK